MTSRFVIWLLCAGAVALAVGPHARSNESAASTTDEQHPLAITTDSTVIAATANVNVHNGVHVTLRVTNISPHDVEITFPSGMTHDVAIVDSTGREVWRWSRGRMFTQALQNKLLDPNQSVSFTESWQPRGQHGRFEAITRLVSSNHPAERRVAFTLP